jgi:para-nitrobenzyl esterase
MNWKNNLRFKTIGVVLVLALMMIPVSYVAAKEKDCDCDWDCGGHGYGGHGYSIVDPIKTDAGYVSGTMIGEIGKEVRIYRGIPYAAPPIGDLRWKPPQPVTPWTGIRECTAFSPWAAQTYPSTVIYQQMTESGMSEDCLYLNVLTPAKKTNERLPVLVWIHGGMLTILSGNMLTYNTPQLPQHGAVVVTISHRLGPFGYMAHPELTAESPNHASGNYGQLDLIAALQWVKKNISNFGGDPDRVTIFGQSGGASKVMWLMTSPLAKGLFHGAWSESGNVNEYLNIVPLATAEENGVKLANQLGASNLADMRAKTWQQIVAAASAIRYSSNFTEDGWSLVESIAETFQTGKQRDVPYMVGFVGNEGAGFYAIQSFIPTIKQRSSKIYAYVFTGVPAGWRAAGATGWHAIDVCYVFSSLADTLGKINAAYFAYNIIPRCPTCTMDPGISPDDEWLANTVKSMVVHFAATGDPSVKRLVKWPPYKYATDQYLKIDYPLEVLSGFSTWTP